MRLVFVFSILFLLLGCSPHSNSAAPQTNTSPTLDTLVKVYTINESFDTAKRALSEALKDRGLVISSISHVSEMLERTGKNLGNTKIIYAKAENIEFCSSPISHASMAADARNIVFCPYIISLYSLIDNPKKTYIAYRRLPRVSDPAADAVLQQIETLLDDVARATMQF